MSSCGKEYAGMGTSACRLITKSSNTRLHALNARAHSCYYYCLKHSEPPEEIVERSSQFLQKGKIIYGRSTLFGEWILPLDFGTAEEKQVIVRSYETREKRLHYTRDQ
jgi:hypothetical protein